jgi:DNA-directed RNA polymerase specialized sigma24 family protein
MTQNEHPGEADDHERARRREEERRERLKQLRLVRRKLTEPEAALLREVFPEIVATHQARLWRRLRRRNVGAATAEDLVQESLLLLYTKILGAGFPTSIWGFLCTLTRGKHWNHVRDQNRSPLSLGLPSSHSMPPATGPGVDSGVALRALAEQILPELSDEHWEVVELVILARYSEAKAAKLLEIPRGTLRARLVAAKKLLAKLAEKYTPSSKKADR